MIHRERWAHKRDRAVVRKVGENVFSTMSQKPREWSLKKEEVGSQMDYQNGPLDLAKLSLS